MTDQELIQALKDYVHNYARHPFDPGIASLIAHRMEQLLALVEEKTSH